MRCTDPEARGAERQPGGRGADRQGHAQLLPGQGHAVAGVCLQHVRQAFYHVLLGLSMHGEQLLPPPMSLHGLVVSCTDLTLTQAVQV